MVLMENYDNVKVKGTLQPPWNQIKYDELIKIKE